MEYYGANLDARSAVDENSNNVDDSGDEADVGGHSDEFREQLIDLVHRYPHLYDKRSEGHINRQMSNNSWSEIAKEVKASGM